MSNYVLTEADIAMLANFSGALNAGRELVQPAERFGNIGIPADPNSSPLHAPSLKWSHADDLAALVARAKGETPQQLAIRGTGPNGEIEKLWIGQAGIDFTMQPGVVYAFLVSDADRERKGVASASIGDDGKGLYGFVAGQLYGDLVPPPAYPWVTGDYGKTAIILRGARDGGRFYLFHAGAEPIGARADVRDQNNEPA